MMGGLRSRWALVVALGIRILAPARVQAQQIEFRAIGVTALTRSTVLISGVREEISGIWLGGAVELRRGILLLYGTGLRGNLTPAGGSPALERDGGQVRGGLQLAARSWLGLEATYGVRAFNSAAGYQRWNIPGAGLIVSGRLGDPAVRGYVRAAYLPSVRVTGQPSPSLGLAAEAGVTAASRSGPLLVGINYRLERYDFPGGTAARLEQFDQITVRVGLALGRGGR